MYHPPILSFFIFILFCFLNFLIFFDFLKFFHPWKTEQGGALTGPPLESEQGGVYNPWHGFFLLPEHLGGFIERCS